MIFDVHAILQFSSYFFVGGREQHVFFVFPPGNSPNGRAMPGALRLLWDVILREPRQVGNSMNFDDVFPLKTNDRISKMMGLGKVRQWQFLGCKPGNSANVTFLG